MKGRIVMFRRLVTSILVMVFVVAFCTAAQCCKKVVLELDYMAGKKPNTSTFVDCYKKCDWAAEIKESDTSCEYHQYMNRPGESAYNYVKKYVNLPAAQWAGKHKVHILGCYEYDTANRYFGYCWVAADDSHPACIMLDNCTGTGHQAHVVNHETGHQFLASLDSDHCSDANCALEIDSPNDYFCNSGTNHEDKIRKSAGP